MAWFDLLARGDYITFVDKDLRRSVPVRFDDVSGGVSADTPMVLAGPDGSFEPVWRDSDGLKTMRRFPPQKR